MRKPAPVTGYGEVRKFSLPIFTIRKMGAGTLPALLMGWLVSCSIQDPSLTTVDVRAPTAQECGSCHVEIFDEWKISKHARAFTNESFRDLTFDYQVNTCLPCHIPETVFLKDEPVQARFFHQEEGVTCIACHLVEGEHHGPFFPAAFTPHGSKADPDFYFDAALCGTCHGGTYETWLASELLDPSIKTCQECHMGQVRRKITQATDLVSGVIVALHDQHDLRKHTFDASILPEDDPVEIRIMAAAPPVEGGQENKGYGITVQNLLPHSIPTGDYGFREVRLVLEWTGMSGKPVRQVAGRLLKDLDTQLDPGGTLRIPIPREEEGSLADCGKVRLMLERVDGKGERVFLIADETLILANGRWERDQAP